MLNTLGERIKNRRIELGLSQDAIAKKLGYTSRSSITKIENGTNALTQPKIEEFAKVLLVSPAYLMGWEEETPTVFSPTQKLLIDKISSLSDEECQKFIDIINMFTNKH